MGQAPPTLTAVRRVSAGPSGARGRRSPLAASSRTRSSSAAASPRESSSTGRSCARSAASCVGRRRSTPAARTVARRDVSSRRLSERLESRGIRAERRPRRAVDRARGAGVVDDARRPRARARALAERGWGDAAVAARLEQGRATRSDDVAAALAQLAAEERAGPRARRRRSQTAERLEPPRTARIRATRRSRTSSACWTRTADDGYDTSLFSHELPASERLFAESDWDRDSPRQRTRNDPQHPGGRETSGGDLVRCEARLRAADSPKPPFLRARTRRSEQWELPSAS